MTARQVIPRRGFKFVFYDMFISNLWKGEKGKAPFAQSMAAGWSFMETDKQFDPFGRWSSYG